MTEAKVTIYAPNWTRPSGSKLGSRGPPKFVTELGVGKGLYDVWWVWGRKYQT